MESGEFLFLSITIFSVFFSLLFCKIVFCFSLYRFHRFGLIRLKFIKKIYKYKVVALFTLHLKV